MDATRQPDQAATEESLRRTLELGPADPEVVALEQELAAATRRAAPAEEVAAVKQRLLQRYFPAVVERGARLDRERFRSDVFFEVYNQRLLALAEELGRPASPQTAIAQLLLAAIYRERQETQRSQQHLDALRRMLERHRVDLPALGEAVLRQMTAAVHALARRPPVFWSGPSGTQGRPGPLTRSGG